MTLVVIGLAVFRITRLLVEDSITDRLRDWISARSLFFGEMLDCPWCASVWIGVGATVAYYFAPELTYWVSLPFAFSAIAGLLSSVR